MNYIILLLLAVTYYMKYIDKGPCRDSEQTSYRCLMDCLSNNEAKCHQMFRMKPHIFLQLCNVLQHTYGLRHTRHVRLVILGQGACNKLVEERS